MKETLFKAFKIITFVVAVGQLAISQVHIGLITKVFEPSVGFLLFAFITFGVVMAFNAVSFRRGSNPMVLVFGGLLSSSAGFLYVRLLFADLNAGNLVTMEEARLSIVLSILSIVAYASSTVVLLFTRNHDER